MVQKDAFKDVEISLTFKKSPMDSRSRGADENPRMLFSDGDGLIYDHPYLEMVGSTGAGLKRVSPEDVIPLPEFSRLFYLPKCHPVGFDPLKGEIVTIKSTRIGRREVPCYAVAAFLEPGYVRTLLPAADYSNKDYILPLWAYTAVGFKDGGYVTSAFQVEYNPCWDPRNFDDREIVPRVEVLLREKGRNPLYRHLGHCAIHNHCFAAKNLFLERWEAPVPVSRQCNARCLGCLSKQPKGSCEPSHERIRFRPRVEDVVDLAVNHMEKARDAIISFGQGCEGEPLMEYNLIAKSIIRIREITDRGTINLNTNGSIPERVDEIIRAGLDSIRISLSSARPPLYNAYFRPKGYSFEDVLRSISISVERGVYTMINYLIFPGISDQEDEVTALFELLRKTGVSFIHLKNLNIDPDFYLRTMPKGDSPCIGIKGLAELLKGEFPGLEVGYFNRALKRD